MVRLDLLFLMSCIGLFVHNGFTQTTAKLYKTNTGEVIFFSETPMENIDAYSATMISAINPSNKNVAAIIIISSFEFKNALMKEHFNEKYLESDKYPKATFSGIINENIDFTKPGNYNVSVTGKFMLHGVEQNRTIKGLITIDNALMLKLHAEFNVKLTDHKIEVPQLVMHKIAEIVSVKINAEYLLK